MKSYESIQDILVEMGFNIDEGQEAFTKWAMGGHLVTIPFRELSGHTVTSFLNKARRRGWLPEEEAQNAR